MRLKGKVGRSAEQTCGGEDKDVYEKIRNKYNKKNMQSVQQILPTTFEFEKTHC